MASVTRYTQKPEILWSVIATETHRGYVVNFQHHMRITSPAFLAGQFVTTQNHLPN